MKSPIVVWSLSSRPHRQNDGGVYQRDNSTEAEPMPNRARSRPRPVICAMNTDPVPSRVYTLCYCYLYKFTWRYRSSQDEAMGMSDRTPHGPDDFLF